MYDAATKPSKILLELDMLQAHKQVNTQGVTLWDNIIGG